MDSAPLRLCLARNYFELQRGFDRASVMLHVDIACRENLVPCCFSADSASVSSQRGKAGRKVVLKPCFFCGAETMMTPYSRCRDIRVTKGRQTGR